MRTVDLAKQRRAHRTAAVAVLLALVLSACLQSAPPASVLFPGVPAVAHYNGTECKRVLVIGDSMASQTAPELAAAYAGTGRCAEVINDAVSGSSVTDWGPSGSLDVRPLLDSAHADLVVAHFVGNEGTAGPSWTDPTWIDQTETAALALVDAVLATGIPIYWAQPPKSAWTCNWEQLSAQRFADWQTWIHDGLWTSRPVGQLDWRTPFGGETFSRTFQFPDGSVRDVRLVDCVHFTPDGAKIAADATVAATQGEWKNPLTTFSSPSGS